LSPCHPPATSRKIPCGKTVSDPSAEAEFDQHRHRPITGQGDEHPQRAKLGLLHPNAPGYHPLAATYVFSRGGCFMIQEKEHEQLSEDRRKEIFFALVDAQDREMDVAQSRSFVVQRFNVSESRVRQIEREGMDNKWPPLC
jgi:hypothetical protein